MFTTIVTIAWVVLTGLGTAIVYRMRGDAKKALEEVNRQNRQDLVRIARLEINRHTGVLIAMAAHLLAGIVVLGGDFLNQAVGRYFPVFLIAGEVVLVWISLHERHARRLVSWRDRRGTGKEDTGERRRSTD